MRRIVVLGAGFGGLSAVQMLERTLKSRKRVQLTLVTDRAHFLFSPLLPNVAGGELNISSISLPLRDHIASDTELIIDRIEGIDLDRRELIGERGRISFDYALLSPGAEINWYGNERWADHAMTCKSARDAVLIREVVEQAYRDAAHLQGEARTRALTFVCAGGGATGVELLAEVRSGLERRIWPHISPELRAATRLLLVEPRRNLLQEFSEGIQRAAYRHLDEVGVELRLGAAVAERTAEAVHLDTGEEVLADHFFWCGGIRSSSLLRETDLSLDEHGRALVDETLEAVDHPNVFIIGDATATPEPTPQNAQAANQQGPLAARNIIAAMSGRAPSTWQFQHKGDLITLGKGNAAIDLNGLPLTGAAAHAMYRVTYAGLMPGTFKKLSILKDWVAGDLAARPFDPRRALPSGR